MERRRLWRRWLAYVTVGEVCGFVVPAVTAVAARGMSDAGRVVPLACAGAVEGSVLGLAQARVLRSHLAGFRSRRWWIATGLAAASAWTLGMLPAATHARWSGWPGAVVGVVAGIGALVLLCSIGIAQALALPVGTTRRWSWVAWSAAGWCGGLGAFFVVAPPLWHEGQSTPTLLAIGLAGGLAMATVMAAITGLGAVRLVARSPLGPVRGEDGIHLLSAVLGAVALDADGRPLGTITDMTVDVGALEGGTGTAPVTGVLVREPGWPAEERPLAGALRPADDGWSVAVGVPDGEEAAGGLRRTDLFLARDVLDAPVVVTTAPHTHGRVSDVLLAVTPVGLAVTGVDLSPGAVAGRLLGRTSLDRPAAVPLSAVHLGSLGGHIAQVTSDSALRRLSPEALAEVLTRTSLTHAREIVAATDREVGRRAVALLHPVLRDRVAGRSGPPRRMLRFRGWRLHRPHRDRHGRS